MIQVLDISAGTSERADRLSNFVPRPFIFRDVLCAGMEGALQALKTCDWNEQLRICQLTGGKAKRAGNKLAQWKLTQTLWWNGKAMLRESQEFQTFLDELFEALANNQEFVEDLLATEDAILVHTMGKADPKETVLTEEEFCSRLMRLRTKLQKQREVA